jgi:hypothetical protein
MNQARTRDCATASSPSKTMPAQDDNRSRNEKSITRLALTFTWVNGLVISQIGHERVGPGKPWTLRRKQQPSARLARIAVELTNMASFRTHPTMRSAIGYVRGTRPSPRLSGQPHVPNEQPAGGADRGTTHRWP